jgi:rhodanese-related sulfurtransferase
MTGPGTPSIDVATLDRARREAPGIVLLDIREPWETALCAIAGSVTIPLGDLPNRIDDVPRDRAVAVICHHGVRSLHATAWLRGRGYDQTYNVTGGIDAWAAQIDPTMRRY